MTRSEFELFLQVAAALCAAFAVFNLFLIKKRGLRATVLSGAFLVLGFTILGYVRQGQSTTVMAGAGLVVALLVVDFLLRAPSTKK